jgi:hypothetical protein
MRLVSAALPLSSLFVGSFAQQSIDLFQASDLNLPNMLVTGFIDTESCYAGLEAADLNGDGRIDGDEYATFVQELGPPGFFDDINSRVELPLILLSTFNVLACLCRTDPNDSACCVGDAAGLDASGAFDGDSPTPNQRSYLFLVCSYTISAIDRVVEMQSAPPSAHPSAAPTTLAPVTPDPTMAPTTSPTSLAPTGAPTTANPSASPTEAPTMTPAPTAPTATPTGSPTQEPLDVEMTFTYDIAVPDETPQSDYLPQLVTAMDSLAPEVLSFVRRQRRLGRRLQTVSLSTVVDDFQTIGTYLILLCQVSLYLKMPCQTHRLPFYAFQTAPINS